MAGDSHGGHEPSKLQKMRDKLDAIDQLVDTIELHHYQAYTSAAEKHLTTEGKKLDYKKLEDSGTQERFVQHMVDFYVERARERFGISKDKKLNDEEVDMLLGMYGNVTKGELLERIRENKGKFTLESFKGLLGTKEGRGILGQVRTKMLPGATSHIRDDPHELEEIVKDMGIADKVDPKYMTRQQVIGLAHNYHLNDGSIPSSVYKGEVFSKEKKPAAAGAAHH
jgi:hypothetical protein